MRLSGSSRPAACSPQACAEFGATLQMDTTDVTWATGTSRHAHATAICCMPPLAATLPLAWPSGNGAAATAPACTPTPAMTPLRISVDPGSCLPRSACLKTMNETMPGESSCTLMSIHVSPVAFTVGGSSNCGPLLDPGMRTVHSMMTSKISTAAAKAAQRHGWCCSVSQMRCHSLRGRASLHQVLAVYGSSALMRWCSQRGCLPTACLLYIRLGRQLHVGNTVNLLKFAAALEARRSRIQVPPRSWTHLAQAAISG